MVISIASKSTNPSNQWTHYDQLASSCSSNSIADFYEADMLHITPNFRSISPKSEQQKPEISDDCDALYETTLMKSFFLESLQKEKTSCIVKTNDRLYQLLGHLNPPPSTSLGNILTQTSLVRSVVAVTVPKNTMVAISKSDRSPRDLKGKNGNFNPTL